jgi:hypothetical protein
MKNYFKLVSITLFTLLFVACSSDDDAAPEPVNEEEVITTMIVTLDGPDQSVTLEYQDLDGDGPDSATINVSEALIAGATYAGSIRLLNETEDPAENVTEEIEEEDDEHQFFYAPSSDLNVEVEYGNFDGNGNPLGTMFMLTTGEASSGALTFTLIHEPDKSGDGVSEGDITNAGGSTDIEVTFELEVQ